MKRVDETNQERSRNLVPDVLRDCACSSVDRKRWDASKSAFATSVSSSSGRADSEPDAFEARLAAHLGELACNPRWLGGGVAIGIARRVLNDYVRLTPRNGKYTSTMLRERTQFVEQFLRLRP